jgi:hypothetical protein
MKIYKVYVNCEGRKFFGSIWEEVGTTYAKNKNQAIDIVFQALWGADNNATFTTTSETILQYAMNGCTLKAEIFNNKS